MRGPCAKRRVRCTILTKDGRRFIGENDCGTPQAACPRTPGEGYEKCASICHQGGHAEIDALARARAAGADLKGAGAHLQGHYWICEPCGKALLDAGVVMVVIDSERVAA